MSQELLNETKEYLRIEADYTEEDPFLSNLILAAKEYVKNATSVVVDDSNGLHRLAIYILISHWYENREAVNMGSVSKNLEFSLKSILLQIENCYSDDVL
jgi:uncharacterized phage protein (predicted DNA packaging)